MADNTLVTKILLLNGTKTEFEAVVSAHPDWTLSKGEPAVEFVPAVGTAEDALTGVKVKIGDGFTAYADLPYVGDDIKAELLAQFAGLDNELDALVSRVDGIAADVETLKTTVSTLGNAVFEIDGDSAEFIAAEGENEGEKITSFLGEDVVLKEGNIAIVKRLIVTGKYSYTAYAYNGTAWAAMDGNYSADNVYFSEDMLFTYNFGKYKTSNGNVTIPAEGKTIKEVLMGAHVDIIDPSMSGPSFSVSAKGSVTQEVGTTYDIPYAVATFTDGTYTYGYQTADGTKVAGTSTKMGITASSIEITNNRTSDTKTASNTNSAQLDLTTANFLSTVSDDMKNLIVTDTSQTYVFTADCTYPASTRIPTNNVGDVKNSETGVEYAAKASGEINDKTSTATITGYRKPFWGYKLASAAIDVTEEIDSTMIRGLQKNGSSAAGLPTSYEVPENTKQVFFAAKKGTKTSLTIKNTTKEPATSVACTKVTDIMVADYRGNDEEGNPINTTAYDVWYVNLDAAFSGTTTLSLTWA